MKHLKHHNILKDVQHGFRQQWSCESQLILTVRDLIQDIENKSQVDVILLDFSKSFEKFTRQKFNSSWQEDIKN